MGQTSIPIESEVRDRLATDKPDNMSWSEYLSVLHSDQEIVVEQTGGNSEQLETEIRRLREQVDRLPQDTAEIVARKYA